MTALGNAGDSQYEHVFEPYLQMDNPRLRSEAANALSKMPSPASLNVLTQQLGQESNSTVQSNIIKAIGRNELSDQHLNTVYQFADSNENVEVRSAAIEALTQQAGHNQEVKTQLKSLIKSETNQHNLRKLMKAVYGGD